MGRRGEKKRGNVFTALSSNLRRQACVWITKGKTLNSLSHTYEISFLLKANKSVLPRCSAFASLPIETFQPKKKKYTVVCLPCRLGKHSSKPANFRCMSPEVAIHF